MTISQHAESMPKNERNSVQNIEFNVIMRITVIKR